MDFKRLLPHLIAIVVFFATVAFFFGPQFQGKELPKGDIRNYIASAKETKDYRKAGGTALWSGTNFGGMPNFQMAAPPNGNQLAKVQKPLMGFMARPAGYFFAGMLCCYLLLILLGISPWLSIAGALGAGLATNGFVLFEAGHMSKVVTVFYLPLVAAGILLAFQKKYIWGGLIFAFGMGLAILAGHPQMLYYFGMTVPFYGFAKLVRAFREGELAHFGKAMGALVMGLLLAVGAGAGLILPTNEYTTQTMRGGQVLETPVVAARNPDARAEDVPASGLEWDYAMQWSNGLIDLVATYSPMAAGGGNGTEISRDTEFGKAMTRVGARLPATFAAPMYHGALPFTEGPAYLGAVVWALFIFGLFTARRSLAVWLGGGTLFIMLISMGKNMEGINHFLYDTLPMLSKFRSPSSALSISTFMMVVLGIVGVHDWLRQMDKDEEKARKQLLYSGVTAAVLGLFVTLILPAFMDFAGANDAGYIQRLFGQQQVNAGPMVDGLIQTRRDLYAADAWRSFLYVGLTFGALFLTFRKTISPLIGGLILAGLIAVDFAGVNATRMQAKDWRRAVKYDALFPKTAADATILADTDPHYRVYNATVDAFQEAGTSYYHKSIGGYSAVKMRRINDVITGYLRQNNQNVLNMLNTKWFILPGQDGQPRARQNPAAFGNAWLASNVQTVATNDAEFAALGTTADLKATAIVHQDFADAVSGLQPTGSGTVRLTKYTPDELTYTFNSDAEQLVVFSEMWYGPDLGWEITIDGTPSELIRANYLLRAARIPAGQHTIVMSFRPGSYYTGKTLATVCSLLILFGLIGYGGWTVYKGQKSAENTK